MTNTIILENPKYVENLGGVIRAAACFGYNRVIWTGDRMDKNFMRAGCSRKARLLREFRHNDYKAIYWERNDRPFDLLEIADVPVCVEFDGAEDLTYFDHPEQAVYVFGPEDGSVSQMFRRHCHRFVRIPSKFCLNLAAAVNVVLADRMMKMTRSIENVYPLDGPHANYQG